MNKVEYMLRNKVNFLSGTMPPAEQLNGKLESLEAGLNCFAERGVDTVVIQPKYMGSRGQIYLFQDTQDCYVISRSGYKQKVDLTEEYQKLIDRFQDEFDNGLLCKILDTEILPWSLFGKGLIQKRFYGYIECVQKELETLQQIGFENILEIDLTYLAGMDKKDIIKKYGHHIWTLCLSLGMTNPQPLQEQLEDAKLFQQQVDLYGQDTSIQIKPFSVLKDIYTDGSEKTCIGKSNFEMFRYVNDDDCIVCLIDEGRKYIKSFFEELTVDCGYEGVVIKPVIVKEDILPYMKVRNPEYLRIIYGYDYLWEDKYEKLLERKRINRKHSQAIKEWQRGLEMLKVPYGDKTVEPLLIEHLKFAGKLKVDPRF